MDEKSIYYIVGVLIIANLGTIGSILVFGGKLVWWLAQADMRIKKNKEDIDLAFTRIRDLEIDAMNKFSKPPAKPI